MRQLSLFLICAGLLFGITSCRASFKEVKKQQGVITNGNDLGADGEKADKNTLGSNPNPPDYPTLERTKELSVDESASQGCDGILVVYEKGKDKNLDGILQPTEVTEVRTECRPNGKDPDDPTPSPTPTNPPVKCPAQNSNPKATCPDDADQNNPGQSGKN